MKSLPQHAFLTGEIIAGVEAGDDAEALQTDPVPCSTAPIQKQLYPEGLSKPVSRSGRPSVRGSHGAAMLMRLGAQVGLNHTHIMSPSEPPVDACTRDPAALSTAVNAVAVPGASMYSHAVDETFASAAAKVPSRVTSRRPSAGASMVASLAAHHPASATKATEDVHAEDKTAATPAKDERSGPETTAIPEEPKTGRHSVCLHLKDLLPIA